MIRKQQFWINQLCGSIGQYIGGIYYVKNISPHTIFNQLTIIVSTPIDLFKFSAVASTNDLYNLFHIFHSHVEILSETIFVLDRTLRRHVNAI